MRVVAANGDFMEVTTYAYEKKKKDFKIMFIILFLK